MKFSVKNLLAITLLAALSVNGCTTYFQMRELQRQHANLNSRLRMYQTVGFEEKKMIFERAIDSTEERKRIFEEYKRAFQWQTQGHSKPGILHE